MVARAPGPPPPPADEGSRGRAQPPVPRGSRGAVGERQRGGRSGRLLIAAAAAPPRAEPPSRCPWLETSQPAGGAGWGGGSGVSNGARSPAAGPPRPPVGARLFRGSDPRKRRCPRVVGGAGGTCRPPPSLSPSLPAGARQARGAVRCESCGGRSSAAAFSSNFKPARTWGF